MEYVGKALVAVAIIVLICWVALDTRIPQEQKIVQGTFLGLVLLAYLFAVFRRDIGKAICAICMKKKEIKKNKAAAVIATVPTTAG